VKNRLGIRGFTIMEAILAAVILMTAFVSLSSLMTETTLDNIEVDVYASDIMLARRVMAITMAKSFANVQTITSTPFGGNFNGYNYAVDVDYVERAALNNPVGYPTDYKRVIVIVSSSGLAGNVELQGLKVAEGK
jgi:Tfp pilus assembly protein PilV